MPNSGTGDGLFVWLSWTPVTEWSGPSQLRAIRWVVASRIKEDVAITGQRLDSEERAQFSVPDAPDSFTETLVLPAPHNYFANSYVIAPVRGCWRFTVRAGTEAAEITLYLAGEPVPPSCPVSGSRQVRGDIAPGIGGPLAWMISSQTGPWMGSDVPIKTIWLIDDRIASDVKVTGERTDGEGAAWFAYGVQLDSVVGGSADEINQRTRQRLIEQRQPAVMLSAPQGIRNDRRGFIFYSAPGCYRFSVETEQGSFEIVQYLTEDLER